MSRVKFWLRLEWPTNTIATSSSGDSAAMKSVITFFTATISDSMMWRSSMTITNKRLSGDAGMFVATSGSGGRGAFTSTTRH